jgi:hypothetical protein
MLARVRVCANAVQTHSYIFTLKIPSHTHTTTHAHTHAHKYTRPHSLTHTHSLSGIPEQSTRLLHRGASDPVAGATSTPTAPPAHAQHTAQGPEDKERVCYTGGCYSVV